MLESDETVTITDTTELLGDVASLYLNQKFSDITLLVNDQKLYAHKVSLQLLGMSYQKCIRSNFTTKCDRGGAQVAQLVVWLAVA